MSDWWRLCGPLWLGLCCALGATQANESAAQIVAPGYGALEFEAPAPGSYQLPVLGSAADGAVLDSDGQSQRLHPLMGDKVVLLSFIYATCSDVNGCPLATMVLRRVKQRLSQVPELAGQLRLLTLSFDPQQDTPQRMKHYGQGLQGSDVEWHFLTTASETELMPILDHYRQRVSKQYDEQGRFRGTFSHILRVYLIDRQRQLRNIYSVSFLHADTLINDVKTLLREDAVQLASSTPALPRYRTGDDKSGYQRADYTTRSQALPQRQGQALDLMAFANSPPLGLPPLPIPADNPLTAAKIQLGRTLFYDRRLSLNNTFSCAMCHIPEQGFSSNEMATAVGIEGRTVRRNTPTLYNVGYARSLFHDGREQTLEQQVWGPLLATNEMGNPSIGFVVERIQQLADYQGRFEAVFGRGPGMETIGQALASYQRTLNAADSAFDRWYFGRQAEALSQAAQRGFTLFTGKAGCADCHRMETDSALFTDHQWHNTGVGYAATMHPQAATQRLQVAPGVFLDVDQAAIAAVSEAKPADLGRYEISQNPADRWKYKTPTLRNTALTAPYMHDGSLATLAEVVAFYNRGGVAHDQLDPRIHPLNLTNAEQRDLVAFLHALTGSHVDALVADGFAAPVGDVE